MTSLPLRIGITGSASTGKTELATALSKRLGIPLIPEEVRAHLSCDAGGRKVSTFASLAISERRQLLESFFGQRLERERELESFVADNTALDFTAYALFHGIYDDLEAVDQALLLTEPGRAVGSYDAVFILPHGGLPYVRDGVRSDSPLGELRFQHLLENVVRSSVAAHRNHVIPRECTSLEQRIEFVVSVLQRSGFLAKSPARVGETNGQGPGTVYLVGAGPGSPELLTVRARELLQRAEVVAPDRLIPPELLAEIPKYAELLPVGHRGRGSRHADHRIHPAVIETALAGRSVLRLKAGDPMVFGRGAEEAEELRAAGIPYEIVPGVSAALGAASYTGIPLTHREHASDVTFVTGHESSSARPGLTRWDSLGQGCGTIVLYMAARRLGTSLLQLVAAGRPATTPAAYIAGATHASQRVTVGTLADLAGRTLEQDHTIPGLVIVGDVVAKRKEIEWLMCRRPLFGRRVLVARVRSGPSRIAAELRELGAQVVESPQVEEIAVRDPLALQQALTSEPVCQVLSDAASVRCLEDLAKELPVSRRLNLLALPSVALTEPAGRALKRLGFAKVLVAQGSCESAVQNAVKRILGSDRGAVLVHVPDVGRPNLVRSLSRMGLDVQEVTVFKREINFPRTDLGSFDVAVYPSSSSVRTLFSSLLSARLRDVSSVSIGPETTAELCREGVRWVEEASEDSIDAVLELTRRMVGENVLEPGVMQ